MRDIARCHLRDMFGPGVAHTQHMDAYPARHCRTERAARLARGRVMSYRDDIPQAQPMALLT